MYIWSIRALSVLLLGAITLSGCGESEPEIVGVPVEESAAGEMKPLAKPQEHHRKAMPKAPSTPPAVADGKARTIQSKMFKYAKKGSLPTIEITNEDLNDPLLGPSENSPQKNSSKRRASADDQEVLRADFKRRTYLKDPYKKEKKDNFRARYGGPRLDKAAVIKRYAPVTIMPVQLEAHCATAWDRGLLHVRVAYLGPQHNLNVFMQENRMLYISFQDEAGSPVYKFEIPISQMKKAPPSMNNGTPTYHVEGQLPLELETYERFFQWTIEWN